jgi:ferredoxin-NADP reductase
VLDGKGGSPDMRIGFIDEKMIRETVPDFAERTFYISGPQAMVDAERRLLRRMGVAFWQIKTDFFPGLA